MEPSAWSQGYQTKLTCHWGLPDKQMPETIFVLQAPLQIYPGYGHIEGKVTSAALSKF